jgi:hypothetical protein
MKAGFEKSDELQAILDNVISKAKEENIYFPQTAPFADTEKNDEAIDDFLFCEESNIKSCLLGYYKELIQFEVDVLFTKARFPVKSLVEMLSKVCIFISENTHKPLHLENKIIDLLQELDKYPGFGQVLQILILKGVLKWFEVCNINENDEGYTQVVELCRFVKERFMQVCVFYFLYFDKNENSRQLDNYLATDEIYKHIKHILTASTDEPTNANDEATKGPQQQPIPDNVLNELEKQKIITKEPLKWLKSSALFAYFVELACDKYNLKHGKNRKLKPFAELFSVTSKSISDAINDYKNKGDLPIGYKIIDEIMK